MNKNPYSESDTNRIRNKDSSLNFITKLTYIAVFSL